VAARTPQRHGRRVLLAGLAFGRAAPAAAQTASRPARLLCGFPPGGSVDAVTRLTSEGLRGRYATTVLVENRPGAGGRLAVEAARAAEPDGTTLLVIPAGHLTILPHVYGAARLRYAPEDFVPVAPLARFPFGFVTGPAVPAEARASLGGFLAWARAQGAAELPVGIPTVGSTPHFLALEFGRAAGIRLQVAPYRGSGPALADVMGGRLPLYVAPLPSSLPLHQAGQVAVIAVTADRRSAFLQTCRGKAEQDGSACGP
jgi:tripartite-type tricarboxylate transporter receptor subunit TctC